MTVEKYYIITILTICGILLLPTIYSFILVRSLEKNFKEFYIGWYNLQDLRKSAVHNSEYHSLYDCPTEIEAIGLSLPIHGIYPHTTKVLQGSTRFLIISDLEQQTRPLHLELDQ